MPSTNGHGPRRAILYARVSTEEQARSGFSLRQQMERLLEYAGSEGYEVVEEVSDAGQSGGSLERPGIDRVRDLVAAGGVSVVLAQDRDRFAREPAYIYLLRQEFAEHGCTLRALNDRGDGSPEGELTDGILDQLAKFERAKIAERTRRGKLRKAREGKLLKNGRAQYGFRYDESGERYEVVEEEMRVVRRIFRELADGASLHSVKRVLEVEGVLSPGNGRALKSGYWSGSYVRRVVEDDVYKQHTAEEIAGLVEEGLMASDVAARLDPSRSYGIFWFNRSRTTRKRVSTSGSDGSREYRWRHSVKRNPREQWIAIPVPDAGVSRELFETAKNMARHNRSKKPRTGRRFFELSGEVFRCAGCGCVMMYYASLVNGKLYSYYKCSRVMRDGKDACPVGATGRLNYRAEEIEGRVWKHVSDKIKDPDTLRADLERMVELERRDLGGDPQREAKAWLEKLTDADRMRSGYQDLAANGLMTFNELGEKLAGLEETSKAARRELDALKGRSERVAQLERDKEALLESYEAVTPEVLDALSPEDRNRFYRMLRLEVRAHPDRRIEVSQGALGVGFIGEEFSCAGLVPRYRA